MRLATRIAFFLVAATSLAVEADEVDDYVAAQMLRKHIPGLSLAVVKDGKLLKARGYGLANVETNTPATPETVYKIGSISKPFLAAGVMLLVQDEKLGLDDRISKHLDGTPDSWKGITIRHLLSHTSGLVKDSPGFEPFAMRPDAEVVRLAYPEPLLFAPGDKWSYSNLGYFVLAEVIRKVSGQSWSGFVAARVFAPARMTATRTTTTTEIVPNRADGYDWSKGRLVKAEDWVAVRPSGAFLSTVLDLANWDAALYSDAVLSSAVREKMWTPIRLNDGSTHPNGLGWDLEPWQGHKRVHHQGGLPGFLADFERFVDDKLTVVVMINSTSLDPTKIAHGVAGFYSPALAPPVFKPIADIDPGITSKAKAAIAGFAGGDLDRSLFNAKLQTWLDNGGRAEMSTAFRSPGPIQSVELVEQKSEGGQRTLRFRVSYPDDDHLAIFHFDREGKITDFGIEPE